MKKNLFYILIIIILIGYFNPMSKLRAQTDPVGTCTYEDSGLGSDATTASECAELGGSWTGPYVLLAPLPCDSGEGCNEGQLTTFDTVGENKIGAYLNLMIKLFIGICAVLAVIMIVIGGIEYMTSELISNKEEGKKRITQAILGLLLALGAYLILWTINPEILNTDLKSLESVTVNVELIQTDLDSGPPSLSAYTGTLPTGAVAACTAGVIKSTTTGIVACSSISANIDKMIADAKQDGYTLWGGGFRTMEQQTALRVKNCNGNTTDKNAPCNPATAVPGHSEHESGIAFDMACNGSTITSTDSGCFIWLQTNASKYGLQNLKVGNEPWHWSIDGR